MITLTVGEINSSRFVIVKISYDRKPKQKKAAIAGSLSLNSKDNYFTFFSNSSILACASVLPKESAFL